MEWQTLDMQQSPTPSPPQIKPIRLSSSTGRASPLFRSSSLVVPRPLKITEDRNDKQSQPEKTEISREVCSIMTHPQPTSCPSPIPSRNQSPFFSHPSSPFEAFSPPDRSHNPITRNSFFRRDMIDGWEDDLVYYCSQAFEGDEIQFYME